MTEGEAVRGGIKGTGPRIEAKKQVGDSGLGHQGNKEDRRTDAGGDRQVNGELLPDITDINVERKLQDPEKRGKRS